MSRTRSRNVKKKKKNLLMTRIYNRFVHLAVLTLLIPTTTPSAKYQIIILSVISILIK